MLQLWSADILEIWVEVYALTLKSLVANARENEKAKLQDECRKKVLAMADRSQSVKVRVKASNLLGFLAEYDSLGSADIFKQYFVVDE